QRERHGRKHVSRAVVLAGLRDRHSRRQLADHADAGVRTEGTRLRRHRYSLREPGGALSTAAVLGRHCGRRLSGHKHYFLVRRNENRWITFDLVFYRAFLARERIAHFWRRCLSILATPFRKSCALQ